MKFDCPYGWKSLSRFGNVALESATVNICDGICDSADRCRIDSCEFYDITPEATKRFLRASAREDTAEHLLAPIN